MFEILKGAAVIAAVVLYMIPSIEADARGHRDAFAITVVNILLGWTIVGWFAARAWAHRRQDQRLLQRAAKRIRSSLGRVTSQKLVEHAKVRTTQECRREANRRGARRQYS
jgi:hypothetical protein